MVLVSSSFFFFSFFFQIKLVEQAPVLQTAFRSAMTMNIIKVKAHHRIVRRVHIGAFDLSHIHLFVEFRIMGVSEI